MQELSYVLYLDPAIVNILSHLFFFTYTTYNMHIIFLLLFSVEPFESRLQIAWLFMPRNKDLLLFSSSITIKFRKLAEYYYLIYKICLLSQCCSLYQLFFLPLRIKPWLYIACNCHVFLVSLSLQYFFFWPKHTIVSFPVSLRPPHVTVCQDPFPFHALHSISPYLANSYSSFSSQPKCHFLRGAVLDSPNILSYPLWLWTCFVISFSYLWLFVNLEYILQLQLIRMCAFAIP